MNRRQRALTTLVCTCAVPLSALANGFVKGPGEVYAKMSYTSNGERELGQGEDVAAQTETSWVARVYAESGLSLPWTSQVALSAALESIRRKGTSGESFESRSLSDTHLQLRSLIGTFTFLESTSWPTTFRLAAQTGLTIPTTPRSFRTGREESRFDDVAPGRESLVAAIDDGKWGWSQGLGVSVSSGGVWVSLGAQQSQDFLMASPRQSYESQLGVSLPWQSWAQVGYSQSRGTYLKAGVDGEPKTGRVVDDVLSAGVGLTFWRGIAVEGGVDSVQPRKGRLESKYVAWTVGLSARTP